jgi:hypothetical protein
MWAPSDVAATLFTVWPLSRSSSAPVRASQTRGVLYDESEPVTMRSHPALPRPSLPRCRSFRVSPLQISPIATDNAHADGVPCTRASVVALASLELQQPDRRRGAETTVHALELRHSFGSRFAPPASSSISWAAPTRNLGGPLATRSWHVTPCRLPASPKEQTAPSCPGRSRAQRNSLAAVCAFAWSQRHHARRIHGPSWRIGHRILRRFRIKPYPCHIGVAVNDAPPSSRQRGLCPWQLGEFGLIASSNRDGYCRALPHDPTNRQFDILAGIYVGAFIDCDR